MAYRLPQAGVRTSNFERRELPSNSYLDLGGPYGKFVPFIIAGEGGFGEHKQLNWTNLFLLNKLGSDIGSDHDEVINQIKVEKDVEKIKELIKRLPREISEQLEGHETHEQVAILADLSRNMDQRMSYLSTEIRRLRSDLGEAMQGIREIREALARMERQNPCFRS
ncbi:uncharacterized protein LOC123420454 [Hordeum vulgare subsp. vulgare]|uniref:Predicted protein n=2 Tax=Hordeum vulgare TaxID=4513 RepID=F2CRA0_HORVV|nr:uncharacterized protein LOC123402755 [Hordeum vulgare subsp. vulgare]XP_044963292.1 uncharacterized protein LOC123420454 [Hordeum vulgare subsp. vulgare]CAA49471.1 18,9 KDa ABA-induced protein [Hordeum vulgare subsp. vulgare]CAC17774.1 stress responsive protein [Hordeum vulgare subsp. vulgare]BAJ85371.1 predicted protein [Hordeum vulgare subsp. vulgare]BAJ90622.1 predicted protein [Hordeum vulgare subsp. vulgare]BAJ91415.1 predicted protein [Hordeum vulgare subsp. vulgare]